MEKVILNYQMLTAMLNLTMFNCTMFNRTMLNRTMLNIYRTVIKIMKLLLGVIILITMSQMMMMYSCKS